MPDNSGSLHMGITNSNEKNFEDKLGEKTGMDLDQGGKSGFWTESNLFDLGQ